MGYKEYSDSYLMSLNKKELINILRCAEHNFRSTEEKFENHMNYVRSNFIELPCKIGDKVYWIDFLNQINEVTVSEFIIGIKNEKGEHPIGHFGSSLFMNREKAEEKVRENKTK